MANQTKKETCEERLENMKCAFSVFDGDGDGKISKEELAEVLEKAGVSFSGEQLSDFMKSVDTDGNGFLDYDEFCVVMRKMVTVAAEIEEKILKTFKAMDADNDEKISHVELKKFLADNGVDLSKEEAEEIVRTVDKDGDGHINYDEFVTMMHILQLPC